MKKLAIIAMMLISITTLAQRTTTYFASSLPDDFQSISFQFDPGGSVHKEGLNSVISLTAVDFGWLEWEVQVQSIVTNKYSDDSSYKLDYIDMQFGPGVMIPLSHSMSITPGFHIGYVYRGKNNIRSEDFGAFIFGATGKLRYWIGNRKKFALIASSAYDLRPEFNKWRLNNRFGVEMRF